MSVIMNEHNLVGQLKTGVERFHQLVHYFVHGIPLLYLPSYQNNVLHAITPAQEQVDSEYHHSEDYVRASHDIQRSPEDITCMRPVELDYVAGLNFINDPAPGFENGQRINLRQGEKGYEGKDRRKTFSPLSEKYLPGNLLAVFRFTDRKQLANDYCGRYNEMPCYCYASASVKRMVVQQQHECISKFLGRALNFFCRDSRRKTQYAEAFWKSTS